MQTIKKVICCETRIFVTSNVNHSVRSEDIIYFRMERKSTVLRLMVKHNPQRRKLSKKVRYMLSMLSYNVMFDSFPEAEGNRQIDRQSRLLKMIF